MGIVIAILLVIVIGWYLFARWLAATWWIILLVILGVFLFIALIPAISEFVYDMLDNISDFFGDLLHDLSDSIAEKRDHRRKIKEMRTFLKMREEMKLQDMQTSNCPNCNARIKPGQKECEYCGTKFIK